MPGVQWFDTSTLTEVGLLLLAFALSAVVGVERNRRLKNAGLRTHTLVGVGSAVFTLVSAYGFEAAANPDSTLDPSRVAAQIVSGIGFLGAGVIFVRRGTVSGLTTAASIWLTAAIGMACGAGVPVLAITATVLHLVTVTLLAKLGRAVQREPDSTTLTMRYRAGEGALPTALSLASAQGFRGTLLASSRVVENDGAASVRAVLQLQGSPSSTTAVIEAISDLAGVASIRVVTDGDES